MKSINPLFASALLDPERRVVDLMVCRLVYGSAILRLINYDEPLYLDVGDGDGLQRFEAFPVKWENIEGGGTMEVDRSTIEVPNVELLVEYGTASQRTTLGDMTLNGVLDGAELWRYQVNLKNLGFFLHSRWDITGAPSTTPTMVSIELQSALGRCVRPCPATIIQGSCNNSLYDDRCTLLRATYTSSATATGGTRTQLSSALAEADGYFALGEIEFTGGLNIGAKRTVGKHLNAGGVLDWAMPLRFSVQAGDTFTVCAGCSKTWAQCAAFGPLAVNNSAHYRAFPNIPPEEVMI
jgi:uncharacterized phage protein (TIGR02218 family)